MSEIPGPTSHIYFSQRLRLHYVDWGNRDAPPLLLVHGGRDHCRNWDWVAEQFRQDYHIIAPDLRGHGDSQWSIGGNYHLADYVYDIAQLLHQTGLTPVTIIGHSLGGAISLHYSGAFADNVTRLVAIEGMGRPPEKRTEEQRAPTERFGQWLTEMRELSGRIPKRYPTLEDAFERMRTANPHLSADQARHLTEHGVNQNEDGSYSWKFDNYVRLHSPFSMRGWDTVEFWRGIRCPTLLVRGTESWATDPQTDGRIQYFHDARCLALDGAGHWVHHDRFEAFVAAVKAFLAES
ncbi:MAG: alpha/beta hydrolase [Gammaproteobacteria bacterium]|nr:alpha/beta hydrolase [Gammaproteobacteria bacterium]